jgi:hypothetical protein
MPKFECKVCHKKIQADYEYKDCNHAHASYEQKNPEHCGQPMMEIIDD